MTTRYRMTTDVRAWRIPESGDLPEEAREAMEGRAENAHRVTGERTDGEMATYQRMHDELPGWTVPDRHYDYWYWFSCEGNQRAGAGDWVVHHEYGIEAMSDRLFRECCTEVAE